MHAPRPSSLPRRNLLPGQPRAPHNAASRAASTGLRPHSDFRGVPSLLVSDVGFRHSDFRGTHRRCRRGFTLTEILVVIVIIVLIIGLAVPALRFITGSRSQAGAANQISAMLARARNDAIGLQLPTGVCFYQDAIGRTQMAEVQQVQFGTFQTVNTPYPVGSYVTDGAGNYYVCTYNIQPNQDVSLGTAGYWQPLNATAIANARADLFDQIVGTDAEPLPSGVGAQTLCDAGQTGGVPNTQDRYLHTGAVIFDANGRLVTQPYWLSGVGIIGFATGYATVKVSSGTPSVTTAGIDIAQNAGTVITGSTALGATAKPCTLFSGIGLVTYDHDSLQSLGTPSGDYVINSVTFGSLPDVSSYGSSTSAGSDGYEENWIDINATPLLVNRYNGTLLSSQ